MNVQAGDFIYKDYEQITESKQIVIKIYISLSIVYFLTKGKAGYVLLKYPTKVYIDIEQGDLFGHVDLAYNKAFFKN